MKKLFFVIISLCMCFSFPAYADSLSNNDENTIQPRASYVFSEYSSAITKSAYGGDAILEDTGSGTITITLQKYASASNSWVALDGPYSKSFSNTTVVAFSKSRILSTKGKYRCKTTVKATVNGRTETKTVYSGTLTINAN